MNTRKQVAAGVALVVGIALAAGAMAAAVPAAARSAQRGAVACPPVFFGLHGMGEGPAPAVKGQKPPFSPELSSFDAAQNDLSGAILIDPVSYPDVQPSVLDVLGTLNEGPLLDAVNTGEANLNTAIKGWVRNCGAKSDIALVGYSMGAWVINDWMRDHPAEWSDIKAVVLYGDPCYRVGFDKGLARRFDLLGTCNLPGNGVDYPYPAPQAQVPFAMQTYCNWLDPICGKGYALLSVATGHRAAVQLAAALACIKLTSGPLECPHYTYDKYGQDPTQGKIYEGAKFVVAQLGVPTR